MTAVVYDHKNNKVGTLDLPGRIFDVPWKPTLIHQVLNAQLANRRRPWAHAKGRGDVRGGGRKPWRQKGTGRARHGSIRSPLWRGGGKAHGPREEKDYGKKVNKKMKQIALFSVLSRKWKDEEIKIFDHWDIPLPKTKTLAGILKPLVSAKKGRKYDVLFVPHEKNINLVRAASNLSKTKVLPPTDLNVYDLLNFKHLFIDQRAISMIDRHYRTGVKTK